MSESLEQRALRLANELLIPICIDDAYIERGDWQAHVIEFARRLLAEQQKQEPTEEQWQDFYDRVWDTDESNPTLELPRTELKRIGLAALASAPVAKAQDGMVMVPRDLLMEAGFLLGRDAKPCPDWQFGVGDCDKPSCDPCRVTRCLNAIDAAIKEQSHEL